MIKPVPSDLLLQAIERAVARHRFWKTSSSGMPAGGRRSCRYLCEAPHGPITGFAFRESIAYLRPMKFEFRIPTVGKTVPSTPEWFHEIKFDGYRLRVERDGKRVRLITRGGHDLTIRFPWIAQAALKNRRSQFVIDGEAVIQGVDGI